MDLETVFSGINVDIDKLKPIGKFSPIHEKSIKGVKYLYVSGTASMEAPYDIEKQSLVTFATIHRLLQSRGSGLEDVVKITAFLPDMLEYDKYNKVRNQVFASFAMPPASSTVEAKLVRPQLRVEIEAFAITEDK